MNHYSNLYDLMKNEEEAKEYFDDLPLYIQETIEERSQSINSFESMRNYAENIARGDN